VTDQSTVATDMGANLYRLHVAGRTYLPAAANVYSDAATAVHAITPAVDALSGDLDHEVGEQIAEILSTVHLALARTAVNLDRAGIALVQIADRFARTDEDARAAFDRLRADNLGELTSTPPPFVRPPVPGDPQPEIPLGLVKES
jgi:hypothetical protein